MKKKFNPDEILKEVNKFDKEFGLKLRNPKIWSDPKNYKESYVANTEIEIECNGADEEIALKEIIEAINSAPKVGLVAISFNSLFLIVKSRSVQSATRPVFKRVVILGAKVLPFCVALKRRNFEGL